MEETFEEELVRKVVLASILEPLPEKKNCTSFLSKSSKSKFEHFLIAGINIYPVFNNLLRHYKEKGIPGIYHYYFEAQKSSFLNRSGGRANQGIIELTLPVIISALDSKKRDVDLILSNVSKVLKQTSKEDVQLLVNGVNFALSHSNHHKNIIFFPEGNNMLEYYKISSNEEFIKSRKFPKNWAYFYGEFSNNFPITRFFYNSLRKNVLNEKEPLLGAVTSAFEEADEKYGEKIIGVDNQHGILADITALAIFLFLIENKDYKI